MVSKCITHYWESRFVRFCTYWLTAMKAIRCTEEEETIPTHLYPPPDEFDDCIENARQT